MLLHRSQAVSHCVKMMETGDIAPPLPIRFGREVGGVDTRFGNWLYDHTHSGYMDIITDLQVPSDPHRTSDGTTASNPSTPRNTNATRDGSVSTNVAVVSNLNLIINSDILLHHGIL